MIDRVENVRRVDMVRNDLTQYVSAPIDFAMLPVKQSDPDDLRR
jgi:hypothetical protein